MTVATTLLSLTAVGYADAQPAVLPKTALIDSRDAADGQWHWLSVEAATGSRTGWVINSGAAVLTMEGGHFHAKLTIEPGQEGADLLLDGTVARGKILAKEVLLGTDASPASISGQLRDKRLGNAIETRIAFHGGQSGDASFLGLYRLSPGNTGQR